LKKLDAVIKATLTPMNQSSRVSWCSLRPVRTLGFLLISDSSILELSDLLHKHRHEILDRLFGHTKEMLKFEDRK